MESSFRNVCISNLLMFLSQYLLFPVIPVLMAEKFAVPVSVTGGAFIAFLAGMLLVGPFTSYLFDTYKRKSVGLIAFVMLLLISAAYAVVRNPVELVIILFLQGVVYIISSSALLTLSIDITTSSNRTKGNLLFGWYTRLGMIAGIAAGILLYLNFGLNTVLITSGIISLLGIFFFISVHVPFRAPIGMKLLGMDRFFMPRSWVLAVNMMIIALIPGILLPVIYYNISDIFLLDDFIIPYFFIVFVGFIIYFPLTKFELQTNDVYKKILMGLSLILISVCFLILFDETIFRIISALLLGFGMAISTIPFLLMFVGLSRHCERATANASHLLFWQVGLTVGIIISCYLKTNVTSRILPFQLCIISAALSLILFILVSFPYYMKRKVR